MARARTASAASNAPVVALVVFGVGFFLCLVLAIVLWTQLGTADQARTEAEGNLREYVSAPEQSDAEVIRFRENNEGTVVGLMLADLQQQQARVRELNRELDTLQADRAAKEQQIAARERDLAATETQLQEAEQQRQALNEQYQKQFEEVRGQLAAAEGRGQSFYDSLGTRDQALKEQMEQTVAEYSRQLREEEARSREQENELALVRRQNEDLQTQLKQQLESVNIAAADAEIISVFNDGRQVSINRGDADRIQPGMTFEVFQPDQLVKLDDYDELRGKATVEITNIDSNTATGRVVRRENRLTRINDGDRLVNLVYDPNTTLKFYVYGGFDIDNKSRIPGGLFVSNSRGGADDLALEATPVPGDELRARDLIRQWGGLVAEDLSFDVDYLVLGIEPPLPRPLSETEVDPEKLRVYGDAKKRYETYRSLIEQARELGIPVLNQNRFLALVGYYRR